MKKSLALGLMFLGGCVVAEPVRSTPPPPPPPPPVVYTPPPPPPPVVHQAIPIPSGQRGISGQEAAETAMRYARAEGFNVHQVKSVEQFGRVWEVLLQGHPPTPGSMRVLVDVLSGQVSGADRYWGEGHGKDHGHNHWEEKD